MIENQTVEYKREYNQKVKNTMLAFLNTDGGTLYLGIDDDASVYGIDGDIDIEARRVSSSFRDSVTPDPSGYFKVELEKREGKYIIVVTVERGSAISYCYASDDLVPQGVHITPEGIVPPASGSRGLRTKYIALNRQYIFASSTQNAFRQFRLPRAFRAVRPQGTRI